MELKEIVDKLRPARLVDIDEIIALYRKVAAKGRKDGSSDWDDSYPSREIAEADVRQAALWVLEVDGRIVSAFSLHAHGEPDRAPLAWNKGKSCVLSRLCVAPRRQGNGLGKDMVRAVGALAKAHGYDWLRLMAPACNPAANAMYCALGFTELGHFEFDDIDFVCYQTRLDDLKNR